MIRKETFFLICIVFLALVLRLWNIQIWEDVYWLSDEIAHLLHSAEIVTKNNYGGGTVPYIVGPPDYLFSVPFIAFQRELNIALVAARLIHAIIGTLTVLPLYFFARKIYREKTALFASFILAVFPAHIFMSKANVEPVVALFFSTLSLYFFYRFLSEKEGKYLYIFAIFSGLSILTHLALVLFFIPLLLFSFILFRPKLNKKSVLLSFLLIFMITYPLTYNILKMRSAFVNLEESINLLDVKGNLLRGVFLSFPSFLGGNIDGVPSSVKYISPLLFFSLIFFLFFAVKGRKKEDLFFLFSFLGGVFLVSTATVSTFRAANFYILIPLICVMSARSISILFDKIEIVVSLILLLILLLPDFLLIAEEMSRTIKDGIYTKIPDFSSNTFYPFCIQELVDEVIKLQPSFTIVETTDPLINHFMNYRVFEIDPTLKFPIRGIHDIVRDKVYSNISILGKNPIVILLADNSSITIFRDERTVFIEKFKNLGFDLNFTKIFSCENYKVYYNFYWLTRKYEINEPPELIR
jgi:hypothetical protein